MEIYHCTIVDSEGYTVEDFQHKQASHNKAEAFELLILEAVRKRDNQPRFFYSE